MRQTADAVMTAMFAWVAALADGLRTRAKRFRTLIELQRDEMLTAERAQSATVTTVVTVGATLLIGIIVMSQIVESVPALGNNSAFSGSLDQVTSILNSSFLLAAILPLVIVAGAVLFFVGNFGNSGNGGR